jgi:maleate isomerase
MEVETNGEMALIPPETIVARTLAESRRVAADICFISCTAIRSAGVIEQIEATLGIPVVTSNQALAWYALRRLGIEDDRPGFGRLFAAPLALKAAA